MKPASLASSGVRRNGCRPRWLQDRAATCPRRPGHNRAMTLRLLALIWGFAEATVFFVVPDVLLTAIPVRDLRAASLACFLALLGALAGGTLM
jgi:hypothetical protein